MSKFLIWNFWFNLRPGALIPFFQTTLLLLIVIFFLSALVIAHIKKRKKDFYSRFRERLFNFSVGNFIIATMLYFFNYELIPFFSARFWYPLWFVVMILWSLYVFKALKRIKSGQEKTEKEKEFNKYLPRKK